MTTTLSLCSLIITHACALVRGELQEPQNLPGADSSVAHGITITIYTSKITFSSLHSFPLVVFLFYFKCDNCSIRISTKQDFAHGTAPHRSNQMEHLLRLVNEPDGLSLILSTLQKSSSSSSSSSMLKVYLNYQPKVWTHM